MPLSKRITEMTRETPSGADRLIYADVSEPENSEEGTKAFTVDDLLAMSAAHTLDLPEAVVLDDADVIGVIDSSDTTAGPDGTPKHVTLAALWTYLHAFVVTTIALALAPLDAAIEAAEDAIAAVLALLPPWIVTPSYLTQGKWYIDSTNGNDANDGATSGTALATWAELARRLGPSARVRPPVDATFTRRVLTIDVLTSLPATDPVTLDMVIAQDCVVWIRGGVATTEYSGTFTGVTAKTTSTNTGWSIADTARAAAAWASDLGKRVRITSGARANTVMWVGANLGSSAMRPSEPCSIDALTTTVIPYPFVLGTVTRQTPQVGDAYAIEALRKVRLGAVRVASDGLSNSATALGGVIVLSELDVNVDNGTDAIITTEGVNLTTWGCRFGPTNANVFLWNSANDCFTSNLNGTNAKLFLAAGRILKRAGLVTGGMNAAFGVAVVTPGSMFYADFDSSFEKTQIQVMPGAAARLSSVQSWDVPSNTTCVGGHAINVGAGAANSGNSDPGGPGASLVIGQYLDGTNIRVWGSGSAGAHLFVAPGSCVAYRAASVAGLTGNGASNFRLGLATATTARGWNESTGAWTSAVNCTWTLLGTAIATGFGGNAAGGGAHNVGLRASIVAQ